MTTSITIEYISIWKYNLSHFILERVMFVVCERWAGDRDRLLYWPKFFLTHSSTSSSSWLGCSTVSHWGPKALNLQLDLNSALCLQLTRTVWAPGYIIVYAHLFLLFFRLFTQVHLLIDGSVEGQYMTVCAYVCISI